MGDSRGRSLQGASRWSMAQGFGWMTRLNGMELGRLMFADEVDMGGADGRAGP